MQKMLSAEEQQAFVERGKELRRRILKMLTKAGSGHPGGSLSAIDLLMVLFDRVLKHDPKNPKWEGRDRFVLSKGHGCPALYVMLADHGYFPAEELDRLRLLGAMLQGHPDMRFLPALEIGTGSLGQGISVAVGLAIAGKLKGTDHKVFCLCGDGEVDEGIVWEASLLAPQRHLDNLVCMVDRNGVQQCSKTSDILTTDPLAPKWEAFGWTTYEIDGHDYDEILWALQPERIVAGKPTMIVARTHKGQGVSFMMGSPDFHGKAPTPEELELALAELA